MLGQVELNNALLILIGGAFLLGAVFAAIFSAWKTAQLRAEYNYLQVALEKKESEFDHIFDEAKKFESQFHHVEMAEARLRSDYENAKLTIQRLNDSHSQLQQTNQELIQQIKQVETKAHNGEKNLERAIANIQAAKEIIDDLRSRLQNFEQLLMVKDKEYKHLLEENQQLELEATKINTYIEEREAFFDSQILQLQENKVALTKEFENLAHKIFEEKGKVFKESNQSGLETLLQPFREQIEGFQKRINEVHNESIKDHSTLNAEIRKVMEIGLAMSEEANNLASALKGDSQKRGAWGEAQLRKTLELSGLMKDAHFEMQTSFRDNEGKQKITDFLINLPDGKHIIIDSKVSLNAFERAMSAEDDFEFEGAIKEHINAVKRHIDDLSRKDYSNLSAIHSPNFVLMFMPIESAYIEALRYQPEIYDYGYQKNVILVSHTTLMPILRTISNLWMIEHSTAEAREISERAGEIYNQVCVIAERLQKLGGSLNAVSMHYNGAVTALVGQQGLYGKVERFNQLSAKASKDMPNLEPIYPDHQLERLINIKEEAVEIEVY